MTTFKENIRIMPTTILIIESSTEVCSVALAVDGRLVDFIESDEGQSHAKLLGVYVETLLNRQKIKANELSAVAVSKGPGSYTGLRIGVSLAKGICYAGQLPLIAVGTLEAMAHHVIHNQPEYHITSSPPPIFCPMIDARRMEVYTMIVAEDGSILKPINAIVVDETFMEKELLKQQVVFFGNGAAKCSKIIQSPNAQFINEIKASAKYMTDLIWQSYINNRFEDVAYFEPFYLKDFVATVPKRIFPL